MIAKKRIAVILLVVISGFIPGCRPNQLPAPTPTSTVILIPTKSPTQILDVTNTPTQTLAPTVTPTQTNTPQIPIVFFNPIYFDAAASEFGGQRIIIDFEELSGESEMDESNYAGLGISFENKNKYPLLIAPGGDRAWGGKIWNESNSLSVGQLPWRPDNGNYNTDDDLTITFNPPCMAAGFTLVDNYDLRADEFIEFMDNFGNVIKQEYFPSNYSTYRGFLGIVSPGYSITTINIEEAAGDGDDICFDDFICYR